MCSFNRGNIEGTNSSKICVWCLCMFYVCEVISFVDWLDRGLIYMWKEFRNVYLLMTWVWPSCVVDRTLKSNYYHYYLVTISAWRPYVWRADSPSNLVYLLNGDDTEKIGMREAQKGLSDRHNAFKVINSFMYNNGCSDPAVTDRCYRGKD